jgi:hypothetical protein
MEIVNIGIQEGSITGLIRMIFIIIGILVVLRFIGKLILAKQSIQEENRLKAEKKRIEAERKYVEKNKGKISILNTPNSKNIEDVPFEEIKDK